MKKESGLKNESKVQKLMVSGSSALAAKNPAGIRIARKSKSNKFAAVKKGYPDLSEIPSDNFGNLSEAGILNIKDLDGGIVSGQLIRPKYDSKELKKSIDTDIFELIPQTKVELPDTVLRSIYNEVTQSVNDLTIEVQVLTNDILNLNSTISELEIENESLRIEADNEKLKANVSEQQATVANQQVAETTIDLQNAIQNSLNEAIQRVSLTARNQALLQENESLREQLFGLSAQTAEGAKSGASNNFTVKVNNGDGDASQQGQDIWAKCSAKDAGSRKMTTTLEVSNVTTDLKITNIVWTFSGSPEWFKVTGTDKVVEPENAVTFGTEFDNSVIGTSKRTGIKPRRRRIGWRGKATNYKKLSLKCEVTFEDGSKDSVTLSTNLRKNRG
jgi:regulator of replication initiation timing